MASAREEFLQFLVEPYLLELEFIEVYNNHNKQRNTLSQMCWIYCRSFWAWIQASIWHNEVLDYITRNCWEVLIDVLDTFDVSKSVSGCQQKWVANIFGITCVKENLVKGEPRQWGGWETRRCPKQKHFIWRIWCTKES